MCSIPGFEAKGERMKISYMFPYPVPAELLRDVRDVIEGRVHYFGPHTTALEAGLAHLCEVPHAVAVSSGSSGILLALHACGIGTGDEIIMPANVYAAVPEAVLLLGGVPMLVEIEDDTYNIDASRVEAAVTPRTRALVVQHTYGHSVDMDPLVDLAGRHGFRIIEDAAHALGALYKGRPAGGLGDIGIFAFSNKGISACGVGGAVVTRDSSLAADVVLRRYHGRQGSYETRTLGYNFRLTEFVAAVASFQLRLLEDWNTRRRANAARYQQGITARRLPVRVQAVRPYAHHSYLHFVIRLRERDALRRHLAARGVDARVHYDPPAYLHRAFRDRLAHRQGDFPLTDATSRECLSLPCHPGVGEAEVDYVVEQIAEFFTGSRP
jgi:dTDP-4-amino-4,6-dideoxygalactose transaminase